MLREEKLEKSLNDIINAAEELQISAYKKRRAALEERENPNAIIYASAYYHGIEDMAAIIKDAVNNNFGGKTEEVEPGKVRVVVSPEEMGDEVTDDDIIEKVFNILFK